MSIESVRSFFSDKGLNLEILEFTASTATVELAAEALGVNPALIAKTMAFSVKDKNILVVTKGDARIDNRKFKDYFNVKPKMIRLEEVLEITGHPVGGVCPFGLKENLDIFLDLSILEFEYVYPAAGSKNSAVKISPLELHEVTGGAWVNVCKENV